MKRFVSLLLLLIFIRIPAFAEESRVSMVCVGDNIIHKNILDSAKRENGEYDFTSIYSHIKDEISAADIAVVNEETMLVSDPSLYSGYPSFGSPYALGDALRDAGFDVILAANNHSYDKGERGVLDTLEYWRNYPDIAIAGIHDKMEDAYTYPVIEKNGIRFAVINLTAVMNRNLPSKKSYLVDTVNAENAIAVELKSARLYADIVIVFIHVGSEYKFDASRAARKWAQLAADAGADIAVFGHSHVLGDVAAVTGAGGNEMPIIYSLGNFVSNQTKSICMLGGMAKIQFVKDESGARVESYEVVPIVTHYGENKDDYSVYLLSEYPQELAEAHYLTKKGDKKFSLEYLEKTLNGIEYFAK